MKLSFNDYFVIENEHDKVSVCGKLKCDCGSEKFKIFHTGRQTKGIFTPCIKKEKKQLLVEVKCSKCEKKIKIYDTSVDGEKPTMNMNDFFEKKQFIYKNNEEFKVRVLINYYEENYMTNKFASIYINLIQDNDKVIVLYEE